jgi:CHAT domain-containing protein
VLGRAVSSYSTSIRTIIEGRSRPQTSEGGEPQAGPAESQALLVAMSKTPGHSALHFAEREVDVIRELCGKMNIKPVEPAPRKKDVASHLPQCQIFHFASHGSSNATDASKSALLLEDWQSDGLSASALQGMNFRRHNAPFLAYLSACGTGRVKDLDLLDEGVHLIGACQVAGFRHVIGTLWEVADKQSVDMARLVYEQLVEKGLQDAAVPRALHKSARELRRRWLDSLTLSSKARDAEPGSSSGTLDALNRERSSADSCEDDAGSRKVVLCDDDDRDIDARTLQWVPYVHFGV